MRSCAYEPGADDNQVGTSSSILASPTISRGYNGTRISQLPSTVACDPLCSFLEIGGRRNTSFLLALNKHCFTLKKLKCICLDCRRSSLEPDLQRENYHVAVSSDVVIDGSAVVSIGPRTGAEPLSDGRGPMHMTASRSDPWLDAFGHSSPVSSFHFFSCCYYILQLYMHCAVAIARNWIPYVRMGVNIRLK